jgi:hypothetical protein
MKGKNNEKRKTFIVHQCGITSSLLCDADWNNIRMVHRRGNQREQHYHYR